MDSYSADTGEPSRNVASYPPRLLRSRMPDLPRNEKELLKIKARQLFYSRTYESLEEVIDEFAQSEIRLNSFWRYLVHYFPTCLSCEILSYLEQVVFSELRENAVGLLHQIFRFNKLEAIIPEALNKIIKPELLFILREEERVSNVVTLSETVAVICSGIFTIQENWEEVLSYISSSIRLGDEVKKKSSMIVLLSIPDEGGPHIIKFWSENSSTFCDEFIVLIHSTDQQARDLAFQASIKVVNVLLSSFQNEISSELVAWIMKYIERRDNGPLNAFSALGKRYPNFISSKFGTIFRSLIKVAEDCEDMQGKCAVITIIRCFHQLVQGRTSQPLLLSMEEKRRLIKLGTGMMVFDIDKPHWVNSNSNPNSVIGNSYLLGKFILDVFSNDPWLSQVE